MISSSLGANYKFKLMHLVGRKFLLFKKIFALIVVFQLVIAPNLAIAQSGGITSGPLRPNDSNGALPTYNAGVDQTIGEYLCIPQGDGTDLAECIDRLYRFGIAAGAILLVLFLVIAGYLYITAGESGKGQAKNMVLSVVTGMALLLGSYVILNFINPSLVVIKPFQPPIFSTAGLPICQDIGFGQDCVDRATGQVVSSGGPGSGKCDSETGVNGLSCKIGCAPTRKVLCNKNPNWEQAIVKASSDYNVDQNIIKAMIMAESQWDEKATSHKGAQGLMQIMPGTWKGCPGNAYNGVDNINCGTKYIRTVLNILKGYGTAENVRWMGAAYNSGPAFGDRRVTRRNDGSAYKQSNVCKGRLNYECPFADASKSACRLTHPTESINHGYKVEEYYNQYKSGACK